MLILLHVIIALTSLILTGLTLISPSRTKLRIAYGLVGLTFLSGSVLVIAKPAHIVQSCISGLMYLSIVSSFIIFAKLRLAKN